MLVGAALNYFDTNDKLQYTNQNVMLSCFDINNLPKFDDQYSEWAAQNNIKVISMHLPNKAIFPDCVKLATSLIDKSITEKLLIIHPPFKNYPVNNIELKIMHSTLEDYNAYLCWENFPWKREKWLRSPYEIAELCAKYDRFKLTFDTSHIDNADYWLNLETMRYLRKFIKVIHLSNRTFSKKRDKIGEIQQYRNEDDYGCHLPVAKGDLRLEPFIKTLVYQLHWDGQIIIEMMPCYDLQVKKQIEIVTQWIS